MKTFILFSFLILNFSIFGCAKYIDINYIALPKDLDVLRYRTVAVIEFKGDKNNQYSLTVEYLLKGLKFQDKPLFNVIDQKTVETFLKERNFQLGIPTANNIAEMGRLIDVDAVWTGNVIESFNKIITPQMTTTCYNYDDKGTCTSWSNKYVDYVSFMATLALMPQLISTSTGEIIYSNRFSHSESKYPWLSMISVSDKKEMLDNVRREVFNDFKLDIAPTIKPFKLELKTDTNDIIEVDRKIFKHSLKFINDGRMDIACGVWRELIKSNIKSITLNYNIGLCLDYEGKYLEALNQMNYTNKMLSEPDKLISLSIKRGEENIRLMNELSQLLDNELFELD